APAAEAREAAIATAAIETHELARRASADPWDTLVGRRITGDHAVEWRLAGADGGADVVVTIDRGTVRDQAGETRQMTTTDLGADVLAVELDGRARRWHHAVLGAERWVAAGPDAFGHRLVELVVEGASARGEDALAAPMPGSVFSVRV